MSDLLSRIDPDGSLARGYHDVRDIRYGDPGLALEHVAEFFVKHGLLRFPDEPTLAEIRERVEALPMPQFYSPTEQRFYFGKGETASPTTAMQLYRNRVLALLEPMKPAEIQAADVPHELGVAIEAILLSDDNLVSKTVRIARAFDDYARKSA